MSTRSRSRNHPYQRRRRSVRQRRDNTDLRRAAAIMESGLDLGGCIDLTGNDSLDSMIGDVIDLTNQSVIDADPVVVISPTDVDNADTFTRAVPPVRSRRHRMYAHFDDNDLGDDEDHDDAADSGEDPTPSSSNSSSSTRGRRGRGGANSTINLDDVSDEELPDVPFHVPDSSAASSGATPTKVTCPVCLETDAQIRRNRQLYSTTCGHIFCSTCIKQAIEIQHACPTCRKRLTKRQIHQIYL